MQLIPAVNRHLLALACSVLPLLLAAVPAQAQLRAWCRKIRRCGAIPAHHDHSMVQATCQLVDWLGILSSAERFDAEVAEASVDTQKRPYVDT